MASIQEISERLDVAQAKLDIEQEQVRQALGVLQSTVDELRANQVDGGTAEQRQGIIDKLDNLIADLESTVPPPTPEPQP